MRFQGSRVSALQFLATWLLNKDFKTMSNENTDKEQFENYQEVKQSANQL